MNIKKDNPSKKIPAPSFIKLAMRNMVRKGSKSISHCLYHFFNFAWNSNFTGDIG